MRPPPPNRLKGNYKISAFIFEESKMAERPLSRRIAAGDFPMMRQLIE